MFSMPIASALQLFETRVWIHAWRAPPRHTSCTFLQQTRTGGIFQSPLSRHTRERGQSTGTDHRRVPRVTQRRPAALFSFFAQSPLPSFFSFSFLLPHHIPSPPPLRTTHYGHRLPPPILRQQLKHAPCGQDDHCWSLGHLRWNRSQLQRHYYARAPQVLLLELRRHLARNLHHRKELPTIDDCRQYPRKRRIVLQDKEHLVSVQRSHRSHIHPLYPSHSPSHQQEVV